jgi:hypothetical protein
VTNEKNENPRREDERMNDDKIERNRQDFLRKVDQVRADADLNHEAKRRMIQDAYDAAMESHWELVRERERAAQKELKDLEGDIFAVQFPHDARTGVEKEAIRESYRSASFHVSGMEAEDLERVLSRAEKTGDKVLARAAYHEGTERGVTRVVDAYVRERPEEGRRWESYVEARTRAEFPAALSAFPPPKPAEL